MPMSEPSYAESLSEEARLWSAAAAEQAVTAVPNWSVHRSLRHNAVQYRAPIDALLTGITPRMRALELGCGSGWLTVAMAERGAVAHGVDIAAGAIEIARGYFETVRSRVAGVASYEVADLNTYRWPVEQYDLVVAKGVLHHLIHADAVVDGVHSALVPGGALWICDNHGSERIATAAAAGLLMLILPTEVTYADKLRGLSRFGLKSPDRIRASMEAEGLSPFEGAGRAVEWPALVAARFDIEAMRPGEAITGYLAGQLRAPDRVALPFLRALGVVDRAMVRVGLLQSTLLLIEARKPARR
jgi:2-polyprenyl-3-methyl-5-hydroxy-6-metoxy-1,4-benzoquinol methylase